MPARVLRLSFRGPLLLDKGSNVIGLCLYGRRLIGLNLLRYCRASIFAASNRFRPSLIFRRVSSDG
jgi:hypothetical protein